jgi:thiol:disulfide interchange protein
MMRRFALIAALTLGLAPALGHATDITPLDHPYDETLDAHAAIAQAFVKARAENKRVLIDLGGNWCLDCKILAAVMAKPEVKPYLDSHYVEVSVDVGRYTRNMDIAKGYGVTVKGVPTVLVLDGDGRLLNATNSQDLTDARSMSVDGIAAYLRLWAVTPGS